MINNFINPYSDFFDYPEKWHISALRNLEFSGASAPRTTYIVSDKSEYFQPDLCQYDLNRYNFRSIDFHENTEIMALGCSHTYGIGVPTELIWPNVVAELTGIEDIVNLGRPGSSIALQVRFLTNYIRIYGAPKIILANFPDLLRYEYINEKGNSEYGSIEKGFQNYSYTNHQACVQSMDAINMLEAICAANRIVLRWQMWTETTQFLEQKFQEIFRNYVQNEYKINFLTVKNASLDIDTDEIVGDFDSLEFGSQCCVDLRKKSKGCFNYGYDRYIVPKKYVRKDFIDSAKLKELKATTLRITEGRLDAHFGSHAHYHWAKNLVDSL